MTNETQRNEDTVEPLVRQLYDAAIEYEGTRIQGLLVLSGDTLLKHYDFLRRLVAQKPERPDYWTPCGQCSARSAEAEELLDVANAALRGGEAVPSNGVVGTEVYHAKL